MPMTRRSLLKSAVAAAFVPALTSVAHSAAPGVTPMTAAKPYKLAISDADLADLQSRLRQARWPVEVAPDSWDRGIPGGYLRHLAQRWQDFDWRAQEAALNQYDQVMLDFEGEQLHAFHIRSKHENATPLVLCHGWPSSGIEYLKLIGPLTDPTAFGGTEADALHLVIPTIPGFGLSPAPRSARWTSAKTARAIAELLNQFGYDRFAIHGTDMGSDVAAQLDVATGGRAIGLHLGTDLDSVIAVASFMGGNLADNANLTEDQKQRATALLAAVADRNGYIAIQSTRPKTLGYALNDSPIGQLAWMAEKFEAWTNPAKRTIEEAVDIDQFLTNVSLYWFGGGGSASANALWEAFKAMGWAPPSATPRGVAVFNASDLVRPLFDPEHQIAHWTEFKQGGHFPAMEEPELLARDLQDFFRPLRA